MKINTKIKLYTRRFGKKTLVGEAIYKGEKLVWRPFSDGLRLLKLKCFQFQKGIVYADDCEYEIK